MSVSSLAPTSRPLMILSSCALDTVTLWGQRHRPSEVRRHLFRPNTLASVMRILFQRARVTCHLFLSQPRRCLDFWNAPHPHGLSLSSTLLAVRIVGPLKSPSCVLCALPSVRNGVMLHVGHVHVPDSRCQTDPGILRTGGGSRKHNTWTIASSWELSGRDVMLQRKPSSSHKVGLGLGGLSLASPLELPLVSSRNSFASSGCATSGALRR